MSIKASVFIATSLDGFIAREDGSVDWLPTPDESKSGEDYGYNAFIETVDAMVMGRHTYEFVSKFDKWFYGDLPVYVLSSRGVEIPGKLEKTVSTVSGSPTGVAKQLADLGYSHLYVDGGKTIQGFLSEGLIYQITITQVPILLGSGIPLFGPLPHDIKLDHLKTKSFANGLVQSRYEVIREK